MPKLKVILVGEGNAGKTTLATRFVEGGFMADAPSFAQDFIEKTIHLGGKEINLECWDTGEKFRTVTASFYRDADVVLFCCSSQEEGHFTALEDWHEQYKRAAGSNTSEVALVVVICKSDLGEAKYLADAKAWAAKIKADLFVTSSKTGENVEKAFTDGCTKVINARYPPVAAKPPAPKKSGCTIL